MKPPILQTDWLNRVAFRPEASTPHAETFFIHAADPKHKNALSVWLNLTCTGKAERHGEVQCLVTVDGAHRSASERWPLQRIQIDPERAGVGIGESAIQEGASSGLVRGGDFAVSWDLALTDALPGFATLPARWLYKGARLNPKMSTPHPAGLIHRGNLEVWHGLTRHVPKEHLDLQGWHVMQGHRWGSRAQDHSAWVLCNSFTGAPQGTYFEAFSGAMRVGALTPDALVGRLVAGRQVFRFDTWRNVFAAPTRCSPTDWAFEMNGPDGRLKGTVKAAPADTVGSPGKVLGKSVHRFCNRMAELTLELTPLHGAPLTLRSNRAFYELVQPEPRGAAQAA